MQPCLVNSVSPKKRLKNLTTIALSKSPLLHKNVPRVFREVPISIATLSGEKFESMFSGGDDILALAVRVPGLYAETSNGRVAPRFIFAV